MVTEFKRKLYKRGSSHETTIPMPLLFAVDKTRKHNVVFRYDPTANRWYILFEELKEKSGKRQGKEEGDKKDASDYI